MKAKKLSSEALLPRRATEGSAGYDLRAPFSFQLYPNRETTFGLGFALEIPEGWVGLIIPRSGSGSRGLRIKNTVGAIDSDYRGEIKMGLYHEGYVNQVFNFERGDAVAQLIIVPFFSEEIEWEDELSETERGDGGFGSTGGAG